MEKTKYRRGDEHHPCRLLEASGVSVWDRMCLGNGLDGSVHMVGGFCFFDTRVYGLRWSFWGMFFSLNQVYYFHILVDE